MKTSFYRSTAALLALLAASAAFASCGGDTDTTTASDSTAAVTETATETEMMQPDLPDTLDYGGETVNIVTNPRVLLPEFNFTEETGDVVSDALYESSRAVSERLNITFAPHEIASSNSLQRDYVSAISTSVMAGDAAYDIICGYSMCFPTLSADGYLHDLLSTEYIDLDKPWWGQRLREQTTVNGNLYFATGDISNQLLYNMVVMFFNKQILADYNLESPYELVDNNQWTIDKMAEMCKGVYTDLNSNGEPDGDDRTGFCSSPVFTDAYWFSAGLNYTEIGADGVPVLSDDIESQKASDLVDKLQNYFHNSGNDLTTSGVGSFKNGTQLFHSDELLMAAYEYRDVTFEYGVVPIPTFSEEDEFSTVASFTYTLYGIPTDIQDTAMSSAVMEAMAYEGWRTVTPAVFETAMKVKYTSDNDSIRMLDLIRASMNFDFGRVFNSMLDSLTFTMFRNAVTNKENWASSVKSNLPKIEKKLEKLLESYESIE